MKTFFSKIICAQKFGGMVHTFGPRRTGCKPKGSPQLALQGGPGGLREIRPRVPEKIFFLSPKSCPFFFARRPGDPGIYDIGGCFMSYLGPFGPRRTGCKPKGSPRLALQGGPGGLREIRPRVPEKFFSKSEKLPIFFARRPGDPGMYELGDVLCHI